MRLCVAILVVLYACAPVAALACTGINSKTKQRIVSRDVNSQTAVDYKGRGSLFWRKTANQCLASAQR